MNLGSVLVTGGAGFIGQQLVDLLVERAAAVRVLDVAPSRKPRDLVEHVRASVLDRAAVRESMRGVGTVFHLAANPHLWARRDEKFSAVNLDGTRIVLEEARRTGVERVVYTSTEAILRPWWDRSGTVVDETAPDPGLSAVPGGYCRSKLLAERLVRSEAEDGLPVTLVYPTIPVGAGDWRLTPPTRMILDLLDGRTPAYLECELDLIAVDDVARGHLLAALRGRPGRRYILGNESITFSGLLQRLERLTGRPIPRRKIPYPVALCTSLASDAWARLTGTAPRAPLAGVRLARSPRRVDTRRARRELGLRCRPVDEALREAADWLQGQGLLRTRSRAGRGTSSDPLFRSAPPG